MAERWPLVGNLPAYMRDPIGFLCATRDRYGDVARVTLGPLEAVLVSHPSLVEEILVTHNKRWKKDQFLQTLRPVLGDGLLSSEGDFWRRQRRLAQPAFHRDRIASYADIMVDYALALVARWRDGETRDVHRDMMHLTLDIVAKTLFGADVGEHADDVGEALETVLSFTVDPTYLLLPFLRGLPTPAIRRFEAAVAKLDAVIYGVIERKRQNKGEKGSADLLSMLLQAVDEDGSSMSDKQLRDECMTLFLAGHETTALALSWTWHLLTVNPEVDAELAKELSSVLEGRRPTLADVPKLKYTANVIAESLRVFPPAWSTGREACEDIELGGFHIPRGSQVWFCPWVIQRDPRFFEMPERFMPERWSGDLQKSLPRYAYFPFGGGPRLCIGQAFAQMEAVLLLATLAQAFRVEVLHVPIPDPTVTLRPKKGLLSCVTRRAEQPG